MMTVFQVTYKAVVKRLIGIFTAFKICIRTFLFSAPPSYAESVRGQTRRYDTVYYEKGKDKPQLQDSVKKSS